MVDRMTTDRLTESQRTAAIGFLGAHSGWGLGLAVPAAGGSEQPLPTGIGWDGGTGTTWRTNLATATTGILFTQRQATSPEPPRLMQEFWSGLTEALVP